MLELETILNQTWPADRWGGERLLLAVSGGADSVALVRAVRNLAPSRELLTVAHFNHGWRGAESDADEGFVRELGQSLGLNVVVGRAASDSDSMDAKTRHSEESARKLRYRFLTQTAQELEAHFIVTAHTASDRVETMLHNLCRGTGLSGTCTPTLFRTLQSGLVLVRPWIGCFREQIEDYLTELKQEYRHDSSNDQQSYRRNFLRHSVMPLLQEVYGCDVQRRLLSYSQIVEDTLDSIRSLAEKYWRDAQELAQADVQRRRFPACPAGAVTIPDSSKLTVVWPVVQQALQTQWQYRGWPLQAMSRNHWEKIRHFWESSRRSPSARRLRTNLPGGIDLRVKRGWLILTNSRNAVE